MWPVTIASLASLSDALTVPTSVWFSAALYVAGESNDGAALDAGTGTVALTVAASVSGTVPLRASMENQTSLLVPRPVTVRVKVSSAPSLSAGIVATGVALVLLSNVTVTRLVGLVSAQL